MNNNHKMNKEMLYINGATLFCVCWGKGGGSGPNFATFQTPFIAVFCDIIVHLGD